MLSSSDSLSGYIDPRVINNIDDIISKYKNEVLIFLLRKGVSYPTEMTRHLGIHIDILNKVLNNLINNKLIVKVQPRKFDPQCIFMERIGEFWETGLLGYERIINMSWWTIAEMGIAYIQLHYKGKGIKINRSLIEFYNLEMIQ